MCNGTCLLSFDRTLRESGHLSLHRMGDPLVPIGGHAGSSPAPRAVQSVPWLSYFWSSSVAAGGSRRHDGVVSPNMHLQPLMVFPPGAPLLLRPMSRGAACPMVGMPLAGIASAGCDLSAGSSSMLQVES